MKTLIEDLKKLHEQTTQGNWRKGATTHDTVCDVPNRVPYHVASFRHANDAQFCDFAHNHMPQLIEAYEKLEQALTMAAARLKDVCMQDDGQAYKEAEKFLDSLKRFEDNENLQKLLQHRTPWESEPKEQGLYYLQDSRTFVGNCPVFWLGGGNGYTTNLDEAGRFTYKEVMAQNAVRHTDIGWKCKELDLLRRATLDMQYMPRAKEKQLALLKG